jgi:hypothetical protein
VVDNVSVVVYQRLFKAFVDGERSFLVLERSVEQLTQRFAVSVLVRCLLDGVL